MRTPHSEMCVALIRALMAKAIATGTVIPGDTWSVVKRFKCDNRRNV